jgi:hypothetical protein
MVNFYVQGIFLGLLGTEFEGFVVLQNVGSPLPVDTA